MSGRDYVMNTIKTVGMKLRPKADRPMAAGYCPEVDVSDELTPDRVTRYQELIGELRRTCQLGRIDIMIKVSMLS